MPAAAKKEIPTDDIYIPCEVCDGRGLVLRGSHGGQHEWEEPCPSADGWDPCDEEGNVRVDVPLCECGKLPTQTTTKVDGEDWFVLGCCDVAAYDVVLFNAYIQWNDWRVLGEDPEPMPEAS